MTAAGLEPIGADRSETAALWCLRLAEAPLSANDQQAFADWLAADPSNRSAFEEAAATWRDFDGAESAPEFLQMRVEALRLATRRPRMPMRRSWALAADAAIVVAAGAGLWVWATAPVVDSTGVGERRVAVLKDGSRISLDASTVVKVRYTSNRRDLELVTHASYAELKQRVSRSLEDRESQAKCTNAPAGR